MSLIILTDRETKQPVAINTDDISTATVLSVGESEGEFPVDEVQLVLRSDPSTRRSFYLPQKLMAQQIMSYAEALGRFASWVEGQ